MTPEEGGSIRHELPSYEAIDPVNWVTRTVQTLGGPLTLSGMTVRQVRRLLDDLDQDALVVYGFEADPTYVPQPLNLGVIAGLGGGEGLVIMFGPEAVAGLKGGGPAGVKP